ncbi:hypothetical protein [Actinophytocola sp.]|uniref:hypothetical protein n=1 Tax=Actinophytocola sp. TaxID=1872138 RepID=UPI003D6AE618
MIAGADTIDRMDVLADGDTLAFVDVDSVRRRAFGATKQDAVFGHAKIASKSLLVRGLNALAAAVSTPLVAATRRPGGGNAAFAREAGVPGMIVVCADSACCNGVCCNGAFVAARRRANARFSVTARMDPKRATGSIVEVPYAAFASRRTHRTGGRLIARRVKRLNRKAAAQGRGNAVADQVFADLIERPLNHLPSSEFDVNAAWPQLAGTAQTRARAVGTMASARHAVARGATIHAELIQVAD